MRLGIVASRFNESIAAELLKRAQAAARELGVDPRTIFRYLEKEPHPIASEAPGGPRDTTR